MLLTWSVLAAWRSRGLIGFPMGEGWSQEKRKGILVVWELVRGKEPSVRGKRGAYKGFTESGQERRAFPQNFGRHLLPLA